MATLKQVQASIRSMRDEQLTLKGQSESLNSTMLENEKTLREYDIDPEGDVQGQVRDLSLALVEEGEELLARLQTL